MKKLLIAALLGVFFVCVCSASAAQDSVKDPITNPDEMLKQSPAIKTQESKNVNKAQPKIFSKDAAMTPGQIADQAAAVYTEALSMEKRAGEYEKAGKIEEAKDEWVALLAKVKNDPILYSRYFEFLNRIGDINAAITQLKKVQQLDPTNTFYIFRLAELLAANDKLGEAKTILTKLINESKDSWIIEDAKRRLKALESLASKTVSSPDTIAVSAPK